MNVQNKTPDTTNVTQISADSDGAYLLGLGTLAAFADFILHTLTDPLADMRPSPDNP